MGSFPEKQNDPVLPQTCFLVALPFVSARFALTHQLRNIHFV